MKKRMLAIIMALVLALAAMPAVAGLAEAQSDGESTASCFLLSTAPYEDMVPLYYDLTWNGGYYYSDMTEDGITVVVDCCAENTDEVSENIDEFRPAFAAMATGSEIADYQESENQTLTEKFTYPVYDVSFTTGENEDTRACRMIIFSTDTHTYAYGFQVSADYAEDAEADYLSAIEALEFVSDSYEPTFSSYLVSTASYEDMIPLDYDFTWNGGYYCADMTEDGITVIVSCCAENAADVYMTSEENRAAFAALVSGSEIADYQDAENQSLTEKFTYPAYDVSFTTGANEDTRVWKMVILQTDTHTYAYAFQMAADYAEEMEADYLSAVESLELVSD